MEWKTGIFPSYKSIGESKELEEERRLCYVGITRAKDILYLTLAKQRTIFGSTTCNKISRFIEEMPKELLDGIEEIGENEIKEVTFDWEYGRSKKSQVKSYNDKSVLQGSHPKEEFKFRTAESFLNSLNKTKTQDTDVDLSKLKKGVRVYHKKFGEGTITSVEQEGDDLKVDIDFDKVGHKRLMAKFANLEII